MNGGTADWGLLSIADVIDEGNRGHANELTSSTTGSGWVDDPNIPLFSTDHLTASRSYARRLVQLLVSESHRKSSNMEDLFLQKSLRSKHSLVASERIRGRLNTIIDFFMSAVATEGGANTLLTTVFLLASSYGVDSKEGILDGLRQVDWKFASGRSCLEIFHAIQSFGNLAEEPDETFGAALFDLAVRSEHLSALVFCMNLPHCSQPRATHYVPPPTMQYTGMAQFSSDSFLPRCCEFPLTPDDRRRRVRCFSCAGSSVAVVSGSTMVHFDQLGMLGTRLVKTEEKQVPLLPDERTVHCGLSGVLIVRDLGRSGVCWKFHFREKNLPSNSYNHNHNHNNNTSNGSGNSVKGRSSLLCINAATIGNSSLQFHFSVCQERLYCLICVSATSAVQRLCYALITPLSSLFSGGQCDLVVSTDHLLKRQAARKSGNPKTLFLTPSSSVSLGRVTLKERFHPFCIELWVYPRNTKETQVILSIGDKAVDEVLIEVEPSRDGLEWRGGSRTPQLGTSFASVTVPGRLVACERWWYVVLNFTGVAWELSVDHKFSARNTALVSPEGIREAKCVLGRSFTGFLSEVRIWNHTRTPTESVRDARRSLDTATEEGLIGYFPINEQGGYVVADYSRHAQHTFLPHGTHFWSPVKQLPVVPPAQAPAIADFLPLAQASDLGDIHFAAATDFLCIAAVTTGPCLTLFYYSAETLQLMYENRTELSSTWDVKSIAYNKDKDSILCCCASRKEENQLVMWEVHSELILPLSPTASYESLWACGKAILMNAAAFLRKLVQTERFLADQIIWWDLGGVSTFAMDAHPGLITTLLHLAKRAKATGDKEMVSDLCVLVHANLFLRLQGDLDKLHEEVGGFYATTDDVLGVISSGGNGAAAQSDGPADDAAPLVRDALFRFAFEHVAEYIGLARICCRCFLKNSARISFVRSHTAKKRSKAEEVLFHCLTDFYRTLYTSPYALESVEGAQELYTALILESTFQLNKTFVTHDRSTLVPVSRCLEVFQEHLFARASDTEKSGPFLNLLVRYSKTLLKSCNNTLVAIVKAIRQNNAAAMMPYDALEVSIIGTLLPSLTLSLPLLPMEAQSTLSRHMQTCRNSLVTLVDSTQTVPMWVTELKTAFSFSLCLIGCSLLDTSSKLDTLAEMVMTNDGASFLPLLCGGHRREGTERDTLVKGLAAGVGPLSKIFDELLKGDNTAIRVLRDESLRTAERQIMAALCALTMPTSMLEEADRSSLEGLYEYIRKTRANTLSQRQTNPSYVSQVEGRANFLSQFELCFHQTGELGSLRQGSEAQVHSDMRSVSADHKKSTSMSEQQKWKKMFRNWKKIKLLKTLISTQEESDDLKKVCSSIVHFVESNISSDVLAEAIDERVQKAKFRLSGMILLKDLCNEARVSSSLATLILPVMAKALHGWHYAHGVECCSNEVMFQIQSAFFQLWDIVVEQCALEKPKGRRLWPNLFMAMAAADWRTIDIKSIRPAAVKVLHNFWETSIDPNTAVRRWNGSLPTALRSVTFTQAQCAQTVTVDKTGRLVHSLGGRSCCAAPCVWEAERRTTVYYLEVLLIDTKAGGSFSIGVGPSDYSISRLPGWDSGSVALQCDEGLLFTGSTQYRLTGYSLGNGDVVGCGWNWEKKQVFWTRNGKVIASTDAPDTNALSPLFGFDGRALVRVNFGCDAFLFSDFSSGLDTHPRIGFVCDAWDTFRVFSLRAVLRLVDSCALQRKLMSAENSLLLTQRIMDIMKPVGSMLKLLAQELARVLKMVPAGSGLATSSLRHITTVLQLLAVVPREASITESCGAIDATCASSVLALFTPNRLDEEFQSLLLCAWFAATHMVEPPHHLLDETAQDGSTKKTGAAAFLYTLLRMGKYLTLAFMDQVRPNGMCVNVTDARCAAIPESVLWLSLSLLQRLNADETHAWSPALHVWVLRTLRTSSTATPDVFLALAILGGAPRLAAMGDRVVIHRSTQWPSAGNLVTYSLADGICQVVEEEKVSIVPLRLVDLVVPEDETCYFPKKDADHHKEQVEAVTDFVLRFFNEAKADYLSGGSRSLINGDFFAAEAQLMTILYRALTRRVLQLPFAFIAVLKETEGLWETQYNNIQLGSLRLEKVLIETSRLYIVSQNARKLPSEAYNIDDSSVASLRNTHTFYEENAPFSGYHDLPWELGTEDPLAPRVNSPPEYSSDTPVSTHSSSFPAGQHTSSDTLRHGRTGSGIAQGPVDHFFFDTGSFLCVQAARITGLTDDFTLDVSLRLTEVHNSYQVLFSQALTTNPFPEPNVLLVARILDGKLQFGHIHAASGKERFTTETELCFVPLGNEDVGRFVRFTFTQSGQNICAYKDGLLQDRRSYSVSVKGSSSSNVLSNNVCIGGLPTDSTASLKGCLMGLRVFSAAFSASVVGELASPSTSTVVFTKSRLVVHLVAISPRGGTFANGTPQETLSKLCITAEGNVTSSQSQGGWNGGGGGGSGHNVDIPQGVIQCVPELDFGYDNEEADLFTLNGAAFVHHPTKNYVGQWKTMREQTLGVLQSAHHVCSRQLAHNARTEVLTQLLMDAMESKESPSPWSKKEDLALLRTVMQHCVSCVAHSGSISLRDKLKSAVLSEVSGRAITKAMQLTGSVLMRTLIDISNTDIKILQFESSHPLKPSSRCLHEVNVPGEQLYHVHFDPRSRQSNLTLSFALDASPSSVVAQAPGLALTTFAVVLPRFFFEIRSDASNAQWGYKASIVYNCRPQLRAILVFRWLLANVLNGGSKVTKELVEFVFSSQCLDQLSRCAYVNTGKTRCVALACLTDMLILWKNLRNVELPSVSGVHIIRRLAEQVHRQKEPPKDGKGVLRSRFVQVVSEFYVAFQDSFRVWSALGDDASAAGLSQRVLSPAEEREAFLRRRGRERSLYVDREDAEHVCPCKWSPNQHVHFELSSERVWTARTTRGAAALVTNSSLSAGCWYFELRFLTAGDIYVGVAPDYKRHPMPSLFLDEKPIAFNGLTGLMEEGSTDSSEACCPIWGNTDIVGVVLDLDRHWCTFYVNGLPSGIAFSFGANNNKAAAATGEQTREEDAVSYCPFFRLGPNEVVGLNFGSTHFEYDIPPNSMPLDPSHLMLDSLLPYNQIRAFQELAAYILTKEQHPLPPFYVEDTDPFEHTEERTGPAHVSMRPMDGVQMNGLDIKNVGNDFSTVVADAAVRDGQWYFEVTLQSQGLMQIGWAICRENLTLLEQTSVGDSASSWAIDLFRRVCWHNGRAEVLPSSIRRWGAGDVIGCALDLNAGELTFSVNGHPISNAKGHNANSSFQRLPKKAYYAPCISLRAGNNVVVNFGSDLFKFKPDGFRALGTCDSWNERIDSFFANERLYTTSQRRAVLQELYQALHPQFYNEGIQEATQPYRRIAKAVEPFFLARDPTGKSFSHVSPKEIVAFLARKDPRLVKEMGEERLSERVSIFVALMLVSATVIPFLPLQKENTSVTTRLFLALREVIFKSYRHSLIDTVLQETNVKTEVFRLSINRARARAQPSSFRASVFGQTLSLVADQHPQLFQTNKRLWNTVLLGEGAEDIGGPFREHLSEMCRELMSTNLPFFVPTPNHVHNIGTHRDAFVPAAGATSPLEVSALVFVGKLMGSCIRSGEPLSLTFPSLVWKSLCGYPITIEDLRDVDQLCVQCIEEFSNIKSHVESAEQFDQVFEMERFVTKLCDNTLKELIWNGSEVKVTYERCGEYAKALLETRLHEFDFPLSRIRSGLLMVVPEIALLLLTPEELELRVCGKADFQVGEVEKTAIFEGLTAEDRRVQLLWQALRDATPTQRRLFLRFVSGRDRLPIRLRIVPFNCQGDPDVNLPRAATCFFSLELPDYSTLDVMKQKLYYCIENCQDIDTDFNARVADVSDEPMLTLSTEETNQQGSAQNPSMPNRDIA